LPLKSVSMLPKKYAHPSSLRCFPAQWETCLLYSLQVFFLLLTSQK
jgi:hypothetical protein